MFGVDQVTGHLAQREEADMTDVTQGELPGIPAAPANRLGDPCPKWCITDHGATFDGAASGITYHMDVHLEAPRRVGGHFVRLVQGPARGPGLSLDVLPVPLREAECLAGLLEGLAGAGPAVLRQLAAAVRDAAAAAAQ
jgi:hypothetical protein